MHKLLRTSVTRHYDAADKWQKQKDRKKPDEHVPKCKPAYAQLTLGCALRIGGGCAVVKFSVMS